MKDNEQMKLFRITAKPMNNAEPELFLVASKTEDAAYRSFQRMYVQAICLEIVPWVKIDVLANDICQDAWKMPQAIAYFDHLRGHYDNQPNNKPEYFEDMPRQLEY